MSNDQVSNEFFGGMTEIKSADPQPVYQQSNFTESSRRLFDFNDTAYNSVIEGARGVYLQKCEEEPKISNEFLEYIRDTANIKVTVKPHFTFDIVANVSRLETEYTYSYLVTSVAAGQVTHGKAQAGGKAGLRAAPGQAFQLHVGQTVFNPELLYNLREVSCNDDLPTPLRQIAEHDFTMSDIADHFGHQSLTPEVLSLLRREAFNAPPDARDFYYNITGFELLNCRIIAFPTDLVFDISVNFNGEEYTQTNLEHPDQIQPLGEESDLHKQFEKDAESIAEEYKETPRSTRVIKLVRFAIPICLLLSLIVFQIIHKMIDHDGLTGAYMFPMVGLYIGSLVAIVLAFPRFPAIQPKYNLFDRNKTAQELREDLVEGHNKDRANHHTLSIAQLIVTLLFTLVLSVGAFFVVIKSANENYYPTPNICKTYYAEFMYHGSRLVMTIKNVDENGTVTMDVEMIGDDHYDRFEATGVVTEKAWFDDQRFRAQMYASELKEYAGFDTGYFKLYIPHYSSKDLDRIQLYPEASKNPSVYCYAEKTFLTRNLHSPEIVKTYTYIAQNNDRCEFTINNCDANGTITATLTVTEKATGNVIVTHHVGNILYKRTDGRIYIETHNVDENGTPTGEGFGSLLIENGKLDHITFE